MDCISGAVAQWLKPLREDAGETLVFVIPSGARNLLSGRIDSKADSSPDRELGMTIPRNQSLAQLVKPHQLQAERVAEAAPFPSTLQ